MGSAGVLVAKLGGCWQHLEPLSIAQHSILELRIAACYSIQSSSVAHLSSSYRGKKTNQPKGRQNHPAVQTQLEPGQECDVRGLALHEGSVLYGAAIVVVLQVDCV